MRDYEPHVAIFGGVRGTELIERLLNQARAVLAGGELCVELDEEEQAAARGSAGPRAVCRLRM